ncbi:similar to Saccharomyces cerevisiae YPL043W NOP4 Nucleolar protein, essential for processing and maturation of 27S pre-rRNA and large ribosomal subunit biogenesis [Maudiozyma barnettii]|uniref:Similar to Saccharomyces cerevisiae YPL043W NOP4 Nucleolar protein, essential for processing and maturation of 27S pre-rRNA and large ribosomal subunit biogenesis n=1 Tax=Maudiozyma barnettii TaxID=61262 RepID=A0A8H2ZM11_9SACH|nr:mRNA-binding ribosome biosynthesis protein NOP4 [Kazachstania barnettii]CAB4256627.1 similar to Saccharomyces cerevisiae YPL043W NOP4 Nucleolar protein, essential for processing and maturation of 27S pre-rRNA and large ribosomal subunit biogenesis [Kazachstania barnettii]CAD1785230.1 similar to Saccharomyces cerevisiae YPL043W NOP4 Nucleolar protein, essential for processing and maturation of 27S pre-rRNA and large ribosomal subunit biogenesis [Kazachstania barnettii]
MSGPVKDSRKMSLSDKSLDLQTLFVRSIPEGVTDETLTSFFSNFAPLKHAVVVKDVNKKSRGFGFVSFASEADAEDALHKSRKAKLENHLLRVDFAKRRDRNKKEESASAPVQKEPSTADDDDDEALKGKPKLIIRNMPWSCRDPNELKKVFSRFGTVVEATIPRKRDGKLCGFAFVTMKKISNCKNVLDNCKDLKIDGRSVAVDFAVQKSRWESYQSKNEKPAKDESSDNDEEENDKDDNNNKKDDADKDNVEMNSDEEVDEEEEKKYKQRNQRNRRDDFSIFVRNVPYDATAESLVDHFSKFGKVRYALPVIDRETGLAKGTAFVAFTDEKVYDYCVQNAPAAGTTSLLIGDDVLPEYVYEGRVLSVTPTLVREEANIRAERNAEKRKEALGKAPGERDKRNLYLLNEGKVVEGSKMAELLSTKDMEIRDKSSELRVEQLKKNPSLHLSMTRLAIRNLPRAMTDKTLKALARKAVVEFAIEVKDGKRHPLSQEEIVRSTKEKYKFMTPEEIAHQKKKDKKHGIVKQAKVIMEVKGSKTGRSRGYGFVEYKDHKHALMGLRWMNVHLVSQEEVVDGLDEEEKKMIDMESTTSRRLCVEFAIENANVVKRRRDNVHNARESSKRKREEKEEYDESAKKAKIEESSKSEETKDGMSTDIKRLIGFKRRQKHHRK